MSARLKIFETPAENAAEKARIVERLRKLADVIERSENAAYGIDWRASGGPIEGLSLYDSVDTDRAMWAGDMLWKDTVHAITIYSRRHLPPRPLPDDWRF